MTTDRPTLVLLPGWGVDVTCWQSVQAALQADFDVLPLALPELPSLSTGDTECLLDAWLQDLLARAPRRAYWLGWSLGGMLVMALSRRYPDRLLGAAVVAAAPRFVEDEGWPGVPRSVVEGFERQLCEAPEQLRRQFLALVAHGDRAARRALKPAVDGEVSLRQGLHLLKSMDVRGAWNSPLLSGVLLSEVDGVLPPTLIAPMASVCGEKIRLTAACHAPMVSAPEIVAEFVRDCFCR